MKKNVFLFILPGVACAQRLWVYDPEIIDHVGQEPSLEDENVLEAMQVIQEQQKHSIIAINRPNVYLGIDLYIINSPAQQDYIMAGNYAAKEQICYGSAYPFNNSS